MKLIAIIIVMAPSLLFGVTVNDIPQIQAISKQLDEQATALYNFATFVKSISDSGWQVTVPFSTITFTLSTQQRQDLVNQYNAQKAAIQSLSSQLP